ncbi:MAG: translation initiation factor, partial [Paramuribaculum sp.]|nr:translation initiation factor [Paramuribaculum sp.]
MNWLEQLQQFRDNNPDLPSGPETTEQKAECLRQKARIDVSIERKGRAGKTATLLTGWELPDDRLLEIAAELKKKLGTGGSARGGDILVQGDRRDEVVSLLE